MRKQRVVLKQQPDVALAGALSVHGFAGDLDRAPIQILETGNQSKCVVVLPQPLGPSGVP